MRKFLKCLLAVLMIVSISQVKTTSAETTSQQIVEEGGYLDNYNNDGVSIGKVIEKTELENVFDITLTVKTPKSAIELSDDPDVAIVIILDISNTMTEPVNDTQDKYDISLEAIEGFVDNFAQYNKGFSLLGAVAFNTNSYEICGLQKVDEDTKSSFLNQFETNTRSILYADDYDSSNTRFTNMEAGLLRAKQMLDAVDNENKYIIFITDGLPTTYLQDYDTFTGYTPKSSSGTVGNDGVFYDCINNNYTAYGTNYSDKAAMKAQDVAEQIKDEGIEVFSIGMGVQTFSAFHPEGTIYLASSDFIMDQIARGGAKTVVYHDGSSYTWNTHVSTIDNNINSSYENWDGEIAIGNVKTNPDAFADWLESGIGSDHYYSTETLNDLNDAFVDIFTTLKNQQEERLNELWVTCDPIPTSSNGVDYVEFVGLFDQSGALSDSITGTYALNGENTASFDRTSKEITWKIRCSGYQVVTENSQDYYLFTLKYRVRLDNELMDFSEEYTYYTNGDATLHYKTVDLIQTESGVKQVISAMKELDFPKPAVEGYYVDITFYKVSSTDSSALEGATFVLSHDSEHCGACYGDYEKSVEIDDMVAVSDETGLVKFENVASGHKYTLTETIAPEGYKVTTDSFAVTVDYDSITVEVTHSNGEKETFTAEEFAQYTVVDEKIQSNENTDPTNPGEKDPTNPGGDDGVFDPINQDNDLADTGDFGLIGFVTIVSVISLVWSFVIYKSKRQIN
ncbi:MAG: SpaA isopeptide-forming pilin-related protein [Erysipelotrichaceae bacterium]